MAGGRKIGLNDIRVPLFAVGTEADHVAPWRSVYKFHLLTDAEVTFVLTNGGHNAGIVSEPGHPHRRYRVTTQRSGRSLRRSGGLGRRDAGDERLVVARMDAVARQRHSGAPVAPPAIGAPKTGYAPVCDAPGTYVRMQ